MGRRRGRARLWNGRSVGCRATFGDGDEDGRAVDVDMAAAEVDVVGRAETKCAGCGHWTLDNGAKESGACGLLTWRARQGKLRPVVSEAVTGLPNPTRTWRLAGGRCEPGSFGWTTATEPTGGRVRAKRNGTEPPRKQVSLRGWSLTTGNPFCSACWTHVFFGLMSLYFPLSKATRWPCHDEINCWRLEDDPKCVFGECRSLPTLNCRSPPAPRHPILDASGDGS